MKEIKVMAKQIRVIQYGLGPIGQAAAKLALEKKDIKLVGAVDIDPDKAGKDLGVILGGKKLGIPVVASIKDLPKSAKPEIAIHCTVSWLNDAMLQFEELAKAGISVVSSTEELLCPSWKYPKLAAKLDKIAKKGGVSILGTGVNPGFVLDTLPIVLSGVCLNVKKIVSEREVNAATRRLPLQQKVGAGITTAEFRRRVKTGKMGHAGFIETIALVAYALGWKLDKITETIQPKIADKTYKTRYLTVQKGQVTGIHQVCKGYKDGKVLIHADLQMYVGAKNPHDKIVIDGEPKIECNLVNGVAGDQATVAMLVNAIPLVKTAHSGLKTMADIRIPRCLK